VSVADAILERWIWTPQPGPQQLAYFSEADVLLYGGAAGGGKTALAVGLATTAHRETLFIRREATQLTSVVDYMAEVVGGREGYNGSDKIFNIPPWDGNQRKVLFGSCPNLGDENRYQGRPRDLLVIDEAANVLEAQARFLMGWVRTTIPDQRCRTMFCSNPPTSAEGEWLIRMFEPWLDPKYPNPAKPGELRWCTTIGGEDTWVESGDPIPNPHPIDKNDLWIYPISRTFIPARVTDNQYLMGTNYMATLQAMPEPLRSQMLKGDFLAGREDNEWQIIPSEWVKMAQERWTERPFVPEQIENCGVDPSRGGADDTVVAYREGNYFHAVDKYKGRDMTTGGAVAHKVMEKVLTSECPVHVDVIGIGAAVVDALDIHMGSRVNAVNVAESSTAKDWTGTLRFSNKRAELWWRMRDLLNPENGQNVALPPDPALFAELCAPRYTVGSTGVRVESKQDIKKRIGRSTDTADAILLAAGRTHTMRFKRGVTHIRQEDA
jgi:hypothetical protein